MGAGEWTMRQEESQDQRGTLAQTILQVDFHDFVMMAAWMSDTDIAQALHIGPREVEALRHKMQRN